MLLYKNLYFAVEIELSKVRKKLTFDRRGEDSPPTASSSTQGDAERDTIDTNDVWLLSMYFFI